VVRLPGAAVYADVYGDLLAEAGAALDAAVATARELTGGRVPVTAERFDEGAVVTQLVHTGNRGRQLVLQHRRLGRLRRLATGSTVNGAAARAAVPVVSVPEGWRRATDRAPLVTAAVQDVHEVEPLLSVAFEEAALRGARLSILHAWWLDPEVLAIDLSYQREQESRIRQELGPVLRALGRDHPGVTTDLDVRYAPPAEALLEAAARSDLLVLGRRHHLLPIGSHLGPVARAVLDRAEGPVLMAPEERSDLPPSVRAHLEAVMS
jgi:nucleotide-binding universal stress UspA family protein